MLTERRAAGVDDLRTAVASMSKAWLAEAPHVAGTPAAIEWWYALTHPEPLGEHLRLWYEGDELVGWAWHEPPELEIHVWTGDPATDQRVFAAIVDGALRNELNARATASFRITSDALHELLSGAMHKEDRLFGICDNFCYEEGSGAQTFKNGKFKVAMRKMLAEDKAPSVADVLGRNTDQLKPEEHAVAMSLVDYLLQREPGKFNAFGKKLRSKTGVREALESVFGLSPLELEAAWKAWVLETYPKQ